MTDLRIEAIHRGRREALRSDNVIVPITQWLDANGAATDDVEDAVSFVAGADGTWFAAKLADFPEGMAH